MIETTPDVSMNDTEAVETIKPSKPKNASKRVSKKPKIITVSVDNASIDFDQTAVDIKQPESPIEPARMQPDIVNQNQKQKHVQHQKRSLRQQRLNKKQK